MNFFDDAEQFMKSKKKELSNKLEYDEEIVKRLQKEFENATLREIEWALSRLKEREDVPNNMNEIIKKIRIWLED